MSAIPFPAGVGWHRHRASAERQALRKSVDTAGRPATLIPGERVLIRWEAGSGAAFVGTDLAAHILADGSWQRIAWTDVDAAGWDPETSRSLLRLWPDTGPASVVRFPAEQRIAAFVAERLTSTQVLRRRIRLAPDAVATVVALREPGRESPCWRVLIDGPGADGQLARAAANEALARLRILVGF